MNHINLKLDKNLDKFKGKVLFPEKLEIANKLIAKAELPKLNTAKQ